MLLADLLAVITRAAARRWTVLHLVNKQIGILPPEICQLVKLRLLYLSRNYLTNLPAEIRQLHYLKELDVDHNELSELPPEIGQLSRLEKLNLSYNELNEIPQEIGALGELTELDLSFNNILSLPTQLGDLNQLRKLKLNDNGFETVPPNIGSLSDLRSLDLSNNPLSTLPSEIGQLSKLVVLSVRNGRLTALPNTIANLRKLRHLELDGNPLTSPPSEVLQQGTRTILAFLRNLQTAGTERFEAKVLLLGQGGVGKTSVLRSLRGLAFQPGETTTRGVDVGRLELTHPERLSVTLKLNVWDFAGQEIEHATHQFFMSNKSVYILVWNSRHGYVQGRLDYWLEMIKSRAPEAPVILVATHADQRWPDINFAAFQQTYPQLVGQYYVDNYSGTGIDELRLAIARWTAQLPLMGQPWPGNWQAVEDELKELQEHHISFEDLEDVCTDLGLTNETDVSALAETLHNLGIILHFDDDAELRDLVVLKPNWITKAISFALTDSETGKSYGRLDHASLPRIWSQYEPALYPAFFSLMNKFELCYQIEDADDLSLIPALLSYAPPSIPELKPKLKMIYRLSSVPPGLMSRFIVRSHRFTQNMHWREGVILAYDGQLAKAELFEHPREFHLTVDGSSPTYFFAVLIDTLDQILQSYPGLGVERKIPCICKGDGTDGERCSYIFSYEDVVLRKEKGKDLIECNFTLDHVSLNQLLYGIHELSSPQIREQVSRVTSEPVEHYRQVILLGQRGVIHNYNRLEFIDSRCPNVFALSRVDARTLLIQLACQSADGWHYASPAASYEFVDNDEIRTVLAPLLLETLPLISHVVPLSGMNISLHTTISRQLGRELLDNSELMREIVELASVDQGGLSAIREALRNFYFHLEGVDSKQTYGGLRNMTTPDGLRRWLCPFHYAQFQPASLRPSESRFDAFLCHNSKEKAYVRDISEYLQQAEINYWLDEERLLGGDRWQDGLARGLRESASTVVFIGAHGWGDWQLEELQVALNLAAGKRAHRVIPLLLPPLREVPADFPAFLRTRHAITLTSLTDASGLERLVTSIRQTGLS
jgi:GTPase SAR1 family protein